MAKIVFLPKRPLYDFFLDHRSILITNKYTTYNFNKTIPFPRSAWRSADLYESCPGVSLLYNLYQLLSTKFNNLLSLFTY